MLFSHRFFLYRHLSSNENLMPQLYCISVYAQWLFGGPPVIVLAKIFVTPQESVFAPLGVYI